MGDTEISWTHRPGTRGRTWNPVQGCRRVSPGCAHCYAETMAKRFARDGWSNGLINLRTGKWNGAARVADHKLAEPLRWRDPSTVFVNSMSDLFYEGFTNEEIAAVFGIMAACPQHTFQILTKRAARMHEWFRWLNEQGRSVIWREATERTFNGIDVTNRRLYTWWRDAEHAYTWPLPNVWLGVSVENQDYEDRICSLLETPAAIRFVSAEPLLGPLDIEEYLDPASAPCGETNATLDLVIAGCESGHGARVCDPSWLRSLRDQCEAFSVDFYLKQAEESYSDEARDKYGFEEHIDDSVEGPITFGNGSKLKARGPGGNRIIERPYLDGFQHIELPR
jgi:protein gp37